jgi:hypothetical protein
MSCGFAWLKKWVSDGNGLSQSLEYELEGIAASGGPNAAEAEALCERHCLGRAFARYEAKQHALGEFRGWEGSG